MQSEFWKWLLGVVSSTGLVGFVAFLMRDTIGKFLAKVVEHRFERRLEVFKGGIRDNEKELDQIRSYLVTAERERNSSMQSKRLEAAEILLRARHGLSQLSMLVEYITILNTEQILKNGNDPKIIEFIEGLLRPLEIDEKIKSLGLIDKTLPRLYLSDKTLQTFGVYEDIILHAAMMMKLFTIPLRDKSKLIKSGNLSKKVIELVPTSKDGFEKWGEGFAFHWQSYFHDEILRSLRSEISSGDELTRDTKSIEALALNSRRAQINIRQSLIKAGLPDTLINADDAAASSFVLDR